MNKKPLLPMLEKYSLMMASFRGFSNFLADNMICNKKHKSVCSFILNEVEYLAYYNFPKKRIDFSIDGNEMTEENFENNIILNYEKINGG